MPHLKRPGISFLLNIKVRIVKEEKRNVKRRVLRDKDDTHKSEKKGAKARTGNDVVKSQNFQLHLSDSEIGGQEFYVIKKMC